MNNLTIGGWDEKRQRYFAYYETIGGGTGACLGSHGQSAVHSHMTNTLNTPIEAIEYSYPLRVIQYSIRRGSGGAGTWHGGDGIRRDIQMLENVQATILSERRKIAPYGLANGDNGSPGHSFLFRNGEEHELGSKGSYSLQAGDILSIQTPGGGGFGVHES
jgi:N-methylhydantoinase B